MLTLVENLRTALGQHIDNLTWMSDSTKAGHTKSSTHSPQIGYPDNGAIIPTLTSTPNSAIGKRAECHTFQRPL